MIICHKLKRKDCLSHEIWRAVEKGWPDQNKNIHFFWGLAENNIKNIRECIKNKEDWYYVDVGYLTKDITRYPSPKIHEYDKTYFRIVKGGIHTQGGKVGTGARLSMLESQGIDVEFKGWKTGETKHILICPSSPTVTYHMNGMSQEDWVKRVTDELRKYTKREIIFRNKPRPNNKWWNTDIKNDLKNAHCLVTNMSLSSIDAVLNMTPVICDGRNISGPIASRDPKYIEKPFRPGRKTMTEWLKFIVENQFNLKEIENGTAYNILKEQGHG